MFVSETAKPIVRYAFSVLFAGLLFWMVWLFVALCLGVWRCMSLWR